MAVKKFLLTFFLSASIFVFSTGISAAEENTATEPTDAVPTKRSLLDKRKEAVTERMEEKKAAVEKRIEEKKESLKERLETKRKEASESMQLKLEAFKERVQQIKDEKKQVLLEKIQDKLTVTNKRRTDFMMSVLEKLRGIVSRLEEKVSKATSDGIDTSAADAAIVNAKTKIAQAETAVANQAGKSYIASVVTETTLRSTVGQTVSQLQTDLRAVHKLVVDAKQAVMTAAREVGKQKKEKVMIESTERTEDASPTAVLTVTETP